MSALPDLPNALRSFAAVSRLLVASDFDGTLAPIVSHPMDAEAVPGSIEALRLLAAAPQTAAAIISGRSVEHLKMLTGGPAGITLVGSHGMEFDTGLAQALDEHQRQLLGTILRRANEMSDRFVGMSIETKPASVAIHLRNVPTAQCEAALNTIDQELITLPGIEVTRGKAVVELAVITTDKGSALEALRVQTNADAVLFVGDDTTDEKAFARLRGGDIGIKVGDGPTLARFYVADPHQVGALLNELVGLRIGR